MKRVLIMMMKRFLMKYNSVYCTDCLSAMQDIDTESVDIVIADPPYNIGKCFGNNYDSMPLDEYITWTKKWLSEAFRILKKTGTLYVYGFSETLAHISTMIAMDKQRWLVWHYTNKNVPSLNFWQRSHESILACWKDKPLFNRDAVREPYTDSFLKNSAGKIRKGTKGRYGKGVETVYNAHNNGALPRDVISISTLAGGASLKERAIFCKTCHKLIMPMDRHKHEEHDLIIHPTQKPIALCDKLIKAACPNNQPFNVLIPFVGSGSECISVIKNGGNYLGFEINPEYVLLAQERISQFNQQNKALNPQRSFW